MFLDKGDIEPLFRIYYAMEEDPEVCFYYFNNIN